MRRTLFAGLTVLEPGEPFSTDGYSFQQRNPEITDKLLQIGAQTHRHDAHAALPRPGTAPSATAVASGGTFPAGVTLTAGYTLVDSAGGETLIVDDLAEVTTPPLIPTPDPPVAAFSSAAGAIGVGTYYYVKTWIDAGGGETTPSPYAVVERPPGYASGQIVLTGLATGSGAAGAAGWRLYKAAAGGTFHFIASGTADTITDAGQLCADCVDTPPTINNTNERNTVELAFPASGAMPYASAGASAVAFRVYASLGPGFPDPSFLGQYPMASAGQTFALTTWAPQAGRPPDVATAIAGANKIDPDVELLDWHWKRPVASAAQLGSGEAGDVRLVRDEGTFYAVLGSAAVGPGDWTNLLGVVQVNEETASYQLALSDVGRVVEMNAAGDTVVTVPPNATVVFPIGAVIEVARMGAGAVTIAPGAGVTLRSSGGLLSVGSQYGSVSLRKRAADEWVVVGDLASRPAPLPLGVAVTLASAAFALTAPTGVALAGASATGSASMTLTSP